MRLSFNKYLAITVTLLCFSNMSFAGTVVECSTKNSSKDYGDATTDSQGVAYGEACHETNAWQQLGKAKIGRSIVDLQGDSGSRDDDVSANRGWNADTSQDLDTTRGSKDTGDNGITWTIQNSDGTWPIRGEDGWWGNTDAVEQGQTVKFRFSVTRSDEGNHKFDELKIWVDWNGQDGFNNNDIGTSGSEILYNTRWYKDQDKNDNSYGDSDYSGNSADYNNDIGAYNSKDTYRNYILETTIPDTAVIGTTWMRARIACENSLTNYTENMNLTSVGYQDQGEVEDYKLTINAKAVTPVPEPTTLFVFASALIGLALSRKKA